MTLPEPTELPFELTLSVKDVNVARREAIRGLWLVNDKPFGAFPAGKVALMSFQTDSEKKTITLIFVDNDMRVEFGRMRFETPYDFEAMLRRM